MSEGNNILFIPDNINSEILAVLENDLKKHDSLLKQLQYYNLSKNKFTVKNSGNAQLRLSNSSPVFKGTSINSRKPAIIEKQKKNYGNNEIDSYSDDSTDEYSNSFYSESLSPDRSMQQAIENGTNNGRNAKSDIFYTASLNNKFDQSSRTIIDNLDDGIRTLGSFEESMSNYSSVNTPRVQEEKIREGLESIASSFQSLLDDFDALNNNGLTKINNKINTLSPLIKNLQSRLTSLENTKNDKTDTTLRTNINKINEQMEELRKKMAEVFANQKAINTSSSNPTTQSSQTSNSNVLTAQSNGSIPTSTSTTTTTTNVGPTQLANAINDTIVFAFPKKEENNYTANNIKSGVVIKTKKKS